nr:Uncharacterised protein [Klebsiella pneumoniae]
MVIMVMILSDCRQSYYIARNTGRNIMTLSDHQRAKSALNANDLNAAQGYLTGENTIIATGLLAVRNLGSLQYRAAKIVANAAANGQKCVMMRSISLISLCLKQKRSARTSRYYVGLHA